MLPARMRVFRSLWKSRAWSPPLAAYAGQAAAAAGAARSRTKRCWPARARPHRVADLDPVRRAGTSESRLALPKNAHNGN